MRGCPVIRNFVAASLLWMMSAHGAWATGVEPAKDLRIDPAPCVAAAVANDDDKIVSLCGALIDNEKTDKADRIKALIARGAAYARHDTIDRAISDYSVALQLDPALADILNARGELWRKKGDRPRSLADFGAAIKLNADHAAARANYKSLALELERLGALKAVAGKPSFNCATARRAVERAICAHPELADLDREISAAHVRVINEARSPREGRTLQREQDMFIARRNASFGRPGYDLQKAMKQRLIELNGVDGY
jgi:tetratricopeptide (TPR) repeat protein